MKDFLQGFQMSGLIKFRLQAIDEKSFTSKVLKRRSYDPNPVLYSQT